jgi:hypothetical protein
MRFMRQLSGDRVSASAIALLVSSLLLLQGLVGAMAQSAMVQGAMAAGAADPLHVICTSSGAAVLDPDPADGSPQRKKAPDCPCASLCRIASGAMPGILGAHPGPAVFLGAKAIEGFAESSGHLVLTLRGLIGEPRAPPILS